MNENDRSIVRFVMVGHGLVHAYELSIPILMTVWLVEFSTTAAVLGLAVTVGYTLFGAGALPGGILVDRYPSRVVIVGCLFGMGVSFLLLGVVSGVVGVTIALAIWGLAASVYHPAGLALISNGVTTPGTGYAYHGVAGNVGTALGPLLTAVLLLTFDWRVVVAALAVPALLGAIYGLALEFDEWAATDGRDADSATGVQSVAELVTDTRTVFSVGFVLILLVITFDGLYYRGVLTFLPELLSDFLVAVTGSADGFVFDDSSPVGDEFDLAQYVYVGLLTVGIGGQYVGGRVTDSYEPERGLVVTLVGLIVVSLVFVPAAEANLWLLLAVTAALGFALFAMQPLTQATIAKYSPPDARGLAFGYTYLAAFGVGAVGATIVGTALTYGTAFVAFVVLATFSLCGLACSWILLVRSRPSEQ